jgi:hypothetical protein
MPRLAGPCQLRSCPGGQLPLRPQAAWLARLGRRLHAGAQTRDTRPRREGGVPLRRFYLFHPQPAPRPSWARLWCSSLRRLRSFLFGQRPLVPLQRRPLLRLVLCLAQSRLGCRRGPCGSKPCPRPGRQPAWLPAGSKAASAAPWARRKVARRAARSPCPAPPSFPPAGRSRPAGALSAGSCWPPAGRLAAAHRASPAPPWEGCRDVPPL